MYKVSERCWRARRIIYMYDIKSKILVKWKARKKMADSANQRVWFPFPGKKKSEYQVLYLKLYLLAVPIQKKLCNLHKYLCKQVNSVQSLSPVWLSATPRSAAPQASLSITNSWSVQLSHPLLSPSPPAFNLSQHQRKIFPVSQYFASCGQNIGVSTSASVLPMNIQEWFSLGWTGWISLQSKGLSNSLRTPQFRSINS